MQASFELALTELEIPQVNAFTQPENRASWRVLEGTRTRQIVDLGSGAGGPAVTVLLQLRREGCDAELILTDLYPNRAAMQRAMAGMPAAIRAELEPVDATNVTPSLVGVRTLFNSLHHFRPDNARRILQNAVDGNQPIVVVEMLSRHPLVLVAVLLSFLPVMLSIPFLRPFRWSWLFWTYLIPVIPAACVWDGAVSWLRIYSEPELRQLIESVDGREGYEWEIGRIRQPPLPASGSYLVGIPRRVAHAAV